MIDPSLPDLVECPVCKASNEAALDFCAVCGASLDAAIEDDDIFTAGEAHDAH
jgi:hypothetical protein